MLNFGKMLNFKFTTYHYNVKFLINIKVIKTIESIFENFQSSNPHSVIQHPNIWVAVVVVLMSFPMPWMGVGDGYLITRQSEM